MQLDVFYDYLCPFVYRTSVLLQNVRDSGERELEVRWRYFSLTQVNSKDDGWTVWDAPESEHVRGRLAFKAAEAARRQDGFEDFHMRLLRARHLDRVDIDDVAVVERVADESGLELDRFRKDVADPKILAALSRDHRGAVAEYGVFGTPDVRVPRWSDGLRSPLRSARARRTPWVSSNAWSRSWQRSRGSSRSSVP